MARPNECPLWFESTQNKRTLTRQQFCTIKENHDSPQLPKLETVETFLKKTINRPGTKPLARYWRSDLAVVGD